MKGKFLMVLGVAYLAISGAFSQMTIAAEPTVVGGPVVNQRGAALQCQVAYEEETDGQFVPFLIEATPAVLMNNGAGEIQYTGQSFAIEAAFRKGFRSMQLKLLNPGLKDLNAYSSGTNGYGVNYAHYRYEDTTGVFPGHKLAAILVTCFSFTLNSL